MLTRKADIPAGTSKVISVGLSIQISQKSFLLKYLPMLHYSSQNSENQKDQPPVNQEGTDEPQIQKQVDRVSRKGKHAGSHERARVLHIKTHPPGVAK